MRNDWLISYDIREPKRLKKVAKFLEGYGVRVQYSIFRIKGNDRDIEKIRWELSKIIETSDSVLYFRFCSACSVRIQAWNETLMWETDKEPKYHIL